MNPLGNRARAEELARLLEGAVAGPSASTAGMASLALRLRALSPALDDIVPLRPDFRASLRQRLVAVATVQGPFTADLPYAADVPTPARALDRVVAWSRTWSAQKRLAAMSGAMASVVALTGVGVASSHSLPGQPFYGLKRASEALQLDLADGDTAKGTKHLEFAATRLREVRALARGEGQLAIGRVQGGGNLAAGLSSSSLPTRINDTLGDFNSETSEGRSLLEGVYRSTGKTAPLRVLASFATQQKQRLSSIIPELPVGTAAAAQESLELVESVSTTANQLLVIGTCNAECDPSAGGPDLPVEPGPTPGTIASPDDNNGVPPCTCGQPSLAPQPTGEPTSSPSPEPTGTPDPTPSTTPKPTSSPTPGILPTGLPTILPTDLPTILPSLPPLPLDLPTELPSILPSLLPVDIRP
jgi:hypothetical protein